MKFQYKKKKGLININLILAVNSQIAYLSKEEKERKRKIMLTSVFRIMVKEVFNAFTL